MGFQLDKWSRSPRSPLFLTCASGVKVCFSRLSEGKRAVFVIASERRSLWRIRREMQPIGYWDIAKEEFVSTVPFLDRDVFLSVGEVIQYFEAEGASSGEFNFCPVCSQKRVGPKIKREIGMMFRFF